MSISVADDITLHRWTHWSLNWASSDMIWRTWSMKNKEQGTTLRIPWPLIKWEPQVYYYYYT